MDTAGLRLQKNKDATLSGSALKVIAMVVMLIDHLAVGLLLYLYSRKRLDLLPFVNDDNLRDVYNSLRAIGRTAFPLFAFLLVEGFIHTRCRLRYLLSMLVFALLSEPFFDMALFSRYDGTSGSFFEHYHRYTDAFYKHQNVYFTLFLALCIIWCSEYLARRFGDSTKAFFLSLIPLVLLSWLAYLIRCDYSYNGTILIYMLYYLRNNAITQALASYVFFAIALFDGLELWSFPAFFLMTRYRGQRGFIRGRAKYIFYLFYPVHLLLIIVIRCLLAPVI